MSTAYGIIRIIWFQERYRRRVMAIGFCDFIEILLIGYTAGMIRWAMTAAGLLAGTKCLRRSGVPPALIQAQSSEYRTIRVHSLQPISWAALLSTIFTGVFMKWRRGCTISPS
ncbi:hypothetical protein AB4Z50_08310 [Paenibacillus sp. 2TAB26]|uniref:hypothetical protein n=1 Tax=Paenibacillus sp. 2TAB26 TaxID=3233005 RepID=UPI003F9B096D